MKKIIDLLLVFITFACLFGCASVPVIEKSQISTKCPLIVGVDVSYSSYTAFHTRVGGNVFTNKKRNVYNIDVDLIEITKEIFVKGLSGIFEDVSCLTDKQLRDKEFDLIFRIRITNADAKSMAKYGSGKVDSKISYEVHVEDNFNNTVEAFTVYGTYVGMGKISSSDVVRGVLFLGTLRLSSLFDEGIAIEDNFYNSFLASGTIAYNTISDRILSSSMIEEIAQREREKGTLPSDLMATLKYSDQISLLPNNTIDAGEQSTITATITNSGKGTAFDVKLNTECDFPCIDFDKVIDIGDIPPGESQTFKVKLYGRLDLKDGTAPLLLQCTEKRGFDSEKIKLSIPTAHLEKPDIVIVDYKINDGKTGLASGNGNGIPENGETIELTAFVKNNGAGRAIKVDLGIASINSGVAVTRKQTEIAQILPGQTMSGKLSFVIPRTYSGGDIRVELKASDVRGASDGVKQLALNLNTIRPVLAYSYNITDRNGNGFVENGETCELEIRVANKGQMEARQSQ